MAAASRLAAVASRYGWRAPFVALAIALANRWNLRQFLRLCKWRLLTRGAKGKGIKIGRDVSVSIGADVAIGRDVHIGDRSILEVYVNPSARLRIGDGAWLSHDCHICSFGSISIGNDALIGEFVSIRDSTHRFAPGEPIMRQDALIGEIVVEDDVWIGRGTIIMGRPEGTRIGKGSVIGANSVVSRSIPAGEVWAGAPARFIKRRV